MCQFFCSERAEYILFELAGPLGFEPRLSVLETDVLTIDTMDLHNAEYFNKAHDKIPLGIFENTNWQ